MGVHIDAACATTATGGLMAAQAIASGTIDTALVLGVEATGNRPSGPEPVRARGHRQRHDVALDRLLRQPGLRRAAGLRDLLDLQRDRRAGLHAQVRRLVRGVRPFDVRALPHPSLPRQPDRARDDPGDARGRGHRGSGSPTRGRCGRRPRSTRSCRGPPGCAAWSRLPTVPQRWSSCAPIWPRGCRPSRST